jgi:UDP-N-acetyl-2-amino-2-deoxyglucuronate dehydrogenase
MTKLGLVGCGRIAPRHVDAIARTEGLELTAVCDIDPENAQEVGAAAGVLTFDTIAAMIAGAEIDGVVLCTPSGMHGRQGVEAAAAGKHVISEKPMATQLRDADELIRACDDARVHLFVVKQNRLNPPIRLLKQAIDKGRFGRIFLANATVRWSRPQAYYDSARWRGTWEFDGGCFMNQASHYVDMLQWLVGPVDRVMAKTATLARNIETEDTGAAVLRFRNGAIGVIEVTVLTYPRNLEGSITIIGETGSVKIGGVAVNQVETWQFAEYDDDDREVEQVDYAPRDVYGTGHIGYYANIAAVLRGEAEPDTDGRDGRKSLELIQAIYTSAREGREVPLPLR